MKVLINANYKALRVGQFVKADEAASEFVFDTEDCEHSVATLLEIGAKNKIDVKKDKKEKVISILENGIIKLELPEMSERPISEVVSEIVAAGVAANKEDDEILIEIVQAGVKFKQAGKLFSQCMADGGYRVTNKERKSSIREILVSAEFEPSTYEEVTEMLESICNTVNDTSSVQALQGIRAYAKEFELEIPKPSKKAKGGFKNIVQDAVVANPDMSQEDFEALCESNKKDVEKCVARMWPNIEFVQRVVAAVRS
jgi:hypothetical protein